MSDDWDMESPDYSCDVSDDFESLDNCSYYPDSETSHGATLRDGEVVERMKPRVSSTHLVWPKTRRVMHPRGRANTYKVVEELPNGQTVTSTVTTKKVAHDGLDLPRGKKSTSKVDAVLYYQDCKERSAERNMRGARYAQRPMSARDDFGIPLSDETLEQTRLQLLNCEDFLCPIEREARRARARSHKRVSAALVDTAYLRSCQPTDVHAPKSAYRKKVPASEVGNLSPHMDAYVAATRHHDDDVTVRTGLTDGGFIIGEEPVMRHFITQEWKKSKTPSHLKRQMQLLKAHKESGISAPVGGFRYYGDLYVFSSLDYRDIEPVRDSQGLVFRGRKIDFVTSDAAQTINLYRIPDEVDDLFCVSHITPTVFRPAVRCLANRYPHGHQKTTAPKSAEVQMNWVPPMDVQHGLPCGAPDSEPVGSTYGTDYNIHDLRDCYDLRSNTVKFLPLCINGVWVSGDLSSCRTRYVPYETISGGQRFVNPPHEEMLIGGARNPYRTKVGSYGEGHSRNKPYVTGNRVSFKELRDGVMVTVLAVTIKPAENRKENAKFGRAMRNIWNLLSPHKATGNFHDFCTGTSGKHTTTYSVPYGGSRERGYFGVMTFNPHFFAQLEFRLTGRILSEIGA